MTPNNRNPSGGDLVVDCGATCEIALFENRTTGHRWYLCPPTSTVLELIEETFGQPDATCGQPGKRHWRFRTLQEGKSRSSFTPAVPGRSNRPTPTGSRYACKRGEQPGTGHVAA